MLEEILKKAKKKADAAEVYFTEDETTTVKFEGGKLSRTDVKSSEFVVLRCFREGRIGYASSTELAPAELVRNALATAKHGKPVNFDLPREESRPEVKVFDGRVAVLAVERMVEAGEAAVDRLLGVDGSLNVEVTVGRSVGRRRMINDAGLDAAEERTYYSFAASFTRAREGDIFAFWDSDARASLDVDCDGVVERLISVLRWADEKVAVKTGKTDLLIDFAETPTLFMPFLVGVNGENVARGSSPLAGRTGEQVLDPRFSMYDDPTLDWNVNTAGFDGEGVTGRRITLLEGGVLGSYLVDLTSAAELGIEATGNAVRYGSRPGPGASNVVVAPGEDGAFDEIVSGTDDGILALALAGAQMGNVLGGELSASIWTGLKVEKGAVVGRVKDTLFAGNIYEMLKDRVKAVSSDVRCIMGSYTVPAVVIADQVVTAG